MAWPMHQLVDRLVEFFPDFPSLQVVWFVARVACVLYLFLQRYWQEGRACRFHSSAVVANKARKVLIRKMVFFFQKVFELTVLLLMVFLCSSYLCGPSFLNVCTYTWRSLIH